jgi:hypothetical protein
VDRTKSQLDELIALLDNLRDSMVDYMQLKEIRGFLGYISMTYSLVTPYLKELHLTLTSYHPGRNEFGWKVATIEWAAYLHKSVGLGNLNEDKSPHMAEPVKEPADQEWEEQQEHILPTPHERKPLPPLPKKIKPVQTLQRDALALISLFKEETPGNVLLQASWSVQYHVWLLRCLSIRI